MLMRLKPIGVYLTPPITPFENEALRTFLPDWEGGMEIGFRPRCGKVTVRTPSATEFIVADFRPQNPFAGLDFKIPEIDTATRNSTFLHMGPGEGQHSAHKKKVIWEFFETKTSDVQACVTKNVNQDLVTQPSVQLAASPTQCECLVNHLSAGDYMFDGNGEIGTGGEGEGEPTSGGGQGGEGGGEK